MELKAEVKRVFFAQKCTDRDSFLLVGNLYHLHDVTSIFKPILFEGIDDIEMQSRRSEEQFSPCKAFLSTISYFRPLSKSGQFGLRV